jgi:hypothetical protein
VQEKKLLWIVLTFRDGRKMVLGVMDGGNTIKVLYFSYLLTMVHAYTGRNLGSGVNIKRESFAKEHIHGFSRSSCLQEDIRSHYYI